MSEHSSFLKLMVDSCKKQGFGFEHLRGMISLCQTDQGEIFFYDKMPHSTSIVAHRFCTNKWITKLLLQDFGIRTPKGMLFHESKIDSAWEWMQKVDSKMAVKPHNYSLSIGVSLNVETKEQLQYAWDHAKNYSKSILVEEMAIGQDYRIFVVEERIVAVALRNAPKVIGDGKSSIKTLIEKKNEQRGQNPFTSKKLIRFNNNTIKHLKLQGFDLDTVLDKGHEAEISPINSISVGGEHHDMTECVHPDFNEVIQAIHRAIPRTGHTGIDMVAQDITRSPCSQEWNIIEVNTNPGFELHRYPVSGKQRDVAGKVISFNHKLLQNKIEDEKNKSYSNIAPLWEEEDLNYTSKNLKRKVLFKAARERNLKVVQFSTYLWFIEDDNKHREFFSYAMANRTSTVAQRMSAVKYLVSRYMDKKGFSTPNSRVFFKEDIDKAWEFASTLGAVVVKPFSGTGGVNVFVNIQEKKSFVEAVLSQTVERFIVEEFIQGEDYRLLIIDGKFIAAIKRTPAHIIGDGRHTISELIDLKNKHRQSNPHTVDKLIRTSSLFQSKLKQKNMTMQTILKKDEKLFIKDVANVKAGGESEDVTELVHKEFQKVAAQIVRTMPNMFIAGLDIITDNISKAPKDQKWALIEINADPGLHMHHFPLKGEKRDVAGVYIDALFPNAKKEALKTPLKKLILTLEGKVQRIGYRKWIKEQSYIFGVDGWVRNLDDDKIQIIVGGMPNAVYLFLEHCIKRFSKAIIDKVGKKTYQGELEKGFTIRATKTSEV